MMGVQLDALPGRTNGVFPGLVQLELVETKDTQQELYVFVYFVGFFWFFPLLWTVCTRWCLRDDLTRQT